MLNVCVTLCECVCVKEREKQNQCVFISSTVCVYMQAFVGVNLVAMSG